jgi:hypothetical protein
LASTSKSTQNDFREDKMKITMQQLKSLIREAVTDIDDDEDEDLVTFDEMSAALARCRDIRDSAQTAPKLEKYLADTFGEREFSEEAQVLLYRKYKKAMRELEG